MKKILIVGASVLQLPAIIKAKEMGFHVGVIDYNCNAVGVSYADEYFNVSTIDIDAVVQTAKDFQQDGIMTLATDMPMRSIAAACQALNLPGISPDVALKSTDKGEMIKAFEAHGVAHPWYYILSDLPNQQDVLNKITYPCISKPTDNSGSRGVMLIHNQEELLEAVQYSSQNGRSGAVIIEEYMQGPEVSVEIMVLKGTAHVLQVTDKLTTGAPHFVEMGHSQPSQLKADDLDKIRQLACSAVMAVGIQEGPAHVEIILTETGPKMVELGARMGGDCITTHLVPLSSGVDMIEATIRVACGEEPNLTPAYNRGSAIRFLDAPQGVICKIDVPDAIHQIDGIKEITFVKGVGEENGTIGSSTDRLGFVIAQAEDAEGAIDICERACRMIDIVVR